MFSSWFKPLTNRVKRGHQYLFSDRHFVGTVKATVYMAAVAVVLATVAVVITATRTTPPIPDTTADFNRLVRVEFVAKNYLKLWLTGTSEDADLVKAMVTDPAQLPHSWSSEPLGVSDLNVADIASMVDADTHFTQWSVTIGATLTVPGSDIPSRNYFAVTLMDQPDSALKALTLPRIVNHQRKDVVVASSYDNAVPSGSALATTVANFAAAYYTTAQSGSLGRYVSSSFTLHPIASSPYTGTEVISIKSEEPFSKNAAPDTTLNLMVTIRASVSTTTFQSLSVPMTVHAIDNGQWVIDDLPSFAYYKG